MDHIKIIVFKLFGAGISRPEIRAGSALAAVAGPGREQPSVSYAGPTSIDLMKKYAKICKICRHEIYMQNMQKSALATLLMTRSEQLTVTGNLKAVLAGASSQLRRGQGPGPPRLKPGDCRYICVMVPVTSSELDSDLQEVVAVTPLIRVTMLEDVVTLATVT